MIKGYDYNSPSRCKLFAAQPAMWVMQYVLGIPQPVGVPAHRGVATEAGVAHGLLNHGVSDAVCIKLALAQYDKLTVFSRDARKDKYRENINDMVIMALDELRPYGEPSDVQGRVEWKPDGLSLPIIGFYDFKWAHKGIVTDLKTTDKMPSDIRKADARQVAFYTGDNMEGRLTYCTPKKCETKLLENVRDHRQALVNICKAIENFLGLSDDPQFFVDRTAPDLDSFYWKEPAARQLAFQYWGV